MIDDTDFLTVAEIADLLRISRMTVYRLVHEGELPAVQVGAAGKGGTIRVPRASLTTYLARSAMSAPPAEVSP